MNKLFLLASLLFLSACHKPEQPPQAASDPEVLITCTYKYSDEYNVEFLEKNKVEYHPSMFADLVVWHITDLNGRRWSINEYEWKDYTCVSNPQE